MTSIKNIDEFENFTIVKDVVFVPKKSKGYWVKLIFNNSSVHINSALCGSVECESDFERFKNLLDQLRSNKRVYLNIASYSREKAFNKYEKPKVKYWCSFVFKGELVIEDNVVKIMDESKQLKFDLVENTKKVAFNDFLNPEKVSLWIEEFKSVSSKGTDVTWSGEFVLLDKGVNGFILKSIELI